MTDLLPSGMLDTSIDTGRASGDDFKAMIVGIGGIGVFALILGVIGVIA